MGNPIKNLSKIEKVIWIASLVVVFISNIVSGIDLLTLIAAWIGVTSLIFAAKGNVWSQILMVIFSILYAIISWKFQYWGEMITYLAMTMPMAIWSTITWFRNPAKSGKEVAIQKLTSKHIFLIIYFGIWTTTASCCLLYLFNTPNLVLSTISIATSFLAAALTMLRSSYYALGYALNDVVLIILWILASIENPVYISVVVNFMIFLIHDLYGFFCWKKREFVQNQSDSSH